jgi:hypothetical protein
LQSVVNPPSRSLEDAITACRHQVNCPAVSVAILKVGVQEEKHSGKLSQEFHRLQL